MKYLAIALFAVGCAGYQAKVEEAKAKVHAAKEAVECRLDVISPYLAYVTSEDLPKYLEGADIVELLQAVDVAKDEVAKAKEAFNACAKFDF